jgi:hypothetical protein
MAFPTIPLPPPFRFPQFEFIDREISRVDQILAAAENLSACAYESPESRRGACDGGFPCSERATVHELASGLEFCLDHFEDVRRG